MIEIQADLLPDEIREGWDRAAERVISAYRFSQNLGMGKLYVAFSGGKDSTVTADLAVKALSNPSLVHIFGDTTLEFPSTIEYAHRFRDAHPDAIFQIAKNDEQNFYDVCEDIGPPARMMRWCCSMFKTGPITRIINSLYRSQPGCVRCHQHHRAAHRRKGGQKYLQRIVQDQPTPELRHDTGAVLTGWYPSVCRILL